MEQVLEEIRKLTSRVETALERRIEPMMYKQSGSIKNLSAALLKAQEVMDDPVKSSDNPYFKSKYADLAEVRATIRKPFADNGLAYIQIPHTDYVNRIDNGATLLPQVSVVTKLVHAESEEWIEFTLTMAPKDDTPQAIGSIITYERRYGLKTIAGLADEDDDGNDASGRAPAQPPSQPPQTQQRKGRQKPPQSNQKKPEPSRPPAEDVKDADGRVRWFAAEGRFNEDIQTNEGMINTAKWKEIRRLVTEKLGNNAKQFRKWLMGVYGCEWYDIRNDLYDGIMATLRDKPFEIMGYKSAK